MVQPRLSPVRLSHALGVVHPHGDTILLSELASDAKPGRALDLGSGTGYVAIDLARRGWDVDAVDISPRALELTRQNAALNGVNVRVFRSNWFDAIQGTYDVIACNPPMWGGETDRTRMLTATLRWARPLAYRLHRATQPLLERHRADLLKALAARARRHLTQGGRLLLVISPSEAAELIKHVAGLVHVRTSTPEDAPPNLNVVTFVFT